MTATVRVFSISGLLIAEAQSNRGYSDSVHVVKYPPLGRDLLSCDTSTADLSEASAAPTGSYLAVVQVEAGKTVYFEVNPPGIEAVEAGDTSPTLSGEQLLQWGEGWRLSVKEVA